MSTAPLFFSVSPIPSSLRFPGPDFLIDSPNFSRLLLSLGHSGRQTKERKRRLKFRLNDRMKMAPRNFGANENTKKQRALKTVYDRSVGVTKRILPAKKITRKSLELGVNPPPLVSLPWRLETTR